VTAFIGRTERGPINEPVAVGSFERYRRIFGGHCDFSFVSHAVQHYFLHGGAEAVVVRVANRATRAAMDVPAQRQSLKLQARQPGSHEFLRVSIDYDGVEEVPDCFNLVVQKLAGKESHVVEDQELFPALSVDPASRRFVVDALKKSRLVRLAGPVPGARPDATRAGHPGHPIPYIEMSRVGTDGDELTDYDIIGSNREGTGLFAFERGARFDLLCIPPAPGGELGLTTFVAAERYCERRRAFLIWDPPAAWRTASDAIAGARQFSCVGRNAMTYFPRVRGRGDAVRFPNGLPACGAVAGALARTDAAGIWRAAAPAALKNTHTAVCDVGDRAAATLKRLGINAFVAAGGRTELCGDVTLAGPGAASSLWRSLRRRRLLLFILNSIEQATAWVAERIESAYSPAALERQVQTFLERLFEQGALAGRTADQALHVRAARTPAPAAGVTLRVGFALQKPHEMLVYEYHYDRSGTLLRYAAGLEAERLIG
jgi:hypothetical protein